MFIRDRESNELTRFSVSADLALVEEQRLSFQSVGLAPGRVRNAYLSATRAYALDALAHMIKDGLPSGSIGTPQRVGDRVIASVGWDDHDNLVLLAQIWDPQTPTTAHGDARPLDSQGRHRQRWRPHRRRPAVHQPGGRLGIDGLPGRWRRRGRRGVLRALG